MKKLVHNITSLYGTKGQKWLDDLDTLTSSLAKRWDLSGIKPVYNMTHHFVAKALQHQSIPVVLKIGCDPKTSTQEARALEAFNGVGAVKLLDKRVQDSALLLEQASDGASLLHHPDDIKLYASLVKKLLNEAKSQEFDHVHLWLASLDKYTSGAIPKDLLQEAIRLKNKLLKQTSQEYLLHGDLHLDNVVKHKDGWLSIDPKGVIGPIEFEVAALDFANKQKSQTPDIMQQRIKLLAKELNLESQKLTDFVFIRLILGAVFSIEDNTDPTPFLQLAKILK